jgi:hypothetical protein
VDRMVAEAAQQLVCGIEGCLLLRAVGEDLPF